MLPSPNPNHQHYTATSRHVASTILLLLNLVASIILLPSRPVAGTVLLLLISLDPPDVNNSVKLSRTLYIESLTYPNQIFPVLLSRPNTSCQYYTATPRHQSLALYCHLQTYCLHYTATLDLSLALYCYSRPIAYIVLLLQTCRLHYTTTPDLSLASYYYLDTSLAPYCYPNTLLALYYYPDTLLTLYCYPDTSLTPYYYIQTYCQQYTATSQPITGIILPP